MRPFGKAWCFSLNHGFGIAGAGGLLLCLAMFSTEGLCARLPASESFGNSEERVQGRGSSGLGGS